MDAPMIAIGWNSPHMDAGLQVWLLVHSGKELYVRTPFSGAG